VSLLAPFIIRIKNRTYYTPLLAQTFAFFVKIFKEKKLQSHTPKQAIDNKRKAI
jgi:hypothetical protein